jgi:hypothetical protein
MFTSKTRIAKIGLALLLVSLILLIPLSAGLAANPLTTGQPNQSCEDIPMPPGHSALARGSAFNPDGVSGSVYAGEQAVNTINSHTVSQYDVACFQMSQH